MKCVLKIATYLFATALPQSRRKVAACLPFLSWPLFFPAKDFREINKFFSASIFALLVLNCETTTVYFGLKTQHYKSCVQFSRQLSLNRDKVIFRGQVFSSTKMLVVIRKTSKGMGGGDMGKHSCETNIFDRDLVQWLIR